MTRKHRQLSRFGLALGAGLVATVVLGLWLSWSVLPQIFSPDARVAGTATAAEPLAPPSPPKHLSTPEPVRAIYMSSWVAGTPSFRDRLVQLIKDTELNTVVIDVKDYTGRISFPVADQTLAAVGASEKRIPDIADFIAELHRNGVYVVARIAAFQDPFITAKRPDLAVKRGDGRTVWTDYKGAKWLDPAAREAWDYLVAIAREAERVGFDELNFDYIRFPSDGNMKDIHYPFFEKTNLTKAENMKQFFTYLRTELGALGVPLSADFFGMTTTNTDDLNIGQLLENGLAEFDYIAPMVYPSHYPPSFMNFANPAAHPYEVIKHSMDEAVRRARAINQPIGKLRPWLQDFDLGASYTAELIRQEKKAVYDSGLTGWMMWNAGNKYTREALDGELVATTTPPK